MMNKEEFIDFVRTNSYGNGTKTRLVNMLVYKFGIENEEDFLRRIRLRYSSVWVDENRICGRGTHTSISISSMLGVLAKRHEKEESLTAATTAIINKDLVYNRYLTYLDKGFEEDLALRKAKHDVEFFESMF